MDRMSTSAEEVFDRILQRGRRVFELEAKSLLATGAKLASPFVEAVQLLVSCPGRVVVVGLGKSGHVAGKLASTLSSTGTPAFFLHAAEALHGDLGVLTPNDVVVAIAYSGETREVLAVVEKARGKSLPIIAITGKPSSTLAEKASVTLDGAIEQEADGHGLAPTSSSAVALGIGDALAVCTMVEKGFSRKNFAELHPGGLLGRSLTEIGSVAHHRSQLDFLAPTDSFRKCIEVINASNFGIAGVLNGDGELVGCVTDGDVRRTLLHYGQECFNLPCERLMTKAPKTIRSGESVLDGVSQMERFQITSLFVISEGGEVAGLLRMHDLLAAKLI